MSRSVLEHPYSWPEPHPRKGAALSARDVGTLLGVGANMPYVWLSRNASGYRGKPVAVEFPEPVGYARKGTSRVPVAYWWTIDILAYAKARGLTLAERSPVNETSP